MSRQGPARMIAGPQSTPNTEGSMMTLKAQPTRNQRPVNPAPMSVTLGHVAAGGGIVRTLIPGLVIASAAGAASVIGGELLGARAGGGERRRGSVRRAGLLGCCVALALVALAALAGAASAATDELDLVSRAGGAAGAKGNG